MTTHAEDLGRTQKQWSILVGTCIGVQFFYLFLLAWSCFNIKRYLIDHQRYKTFSVLIFYVLVVVIAILRFTMYFGNTLYFYQVPLKAFSRPYVFNICYVLSCYAKIILGFFQAACMVELYIRLATPDIKDQDRRVRNVFMAATAVNIVCVILGLYLAYRITTVLIRVY